MKTYQLKNLLQTHYFGRMICSEVGVHPMEIPSKYLVIGTNPPTLMVGDPTFNIIWMPTGTTAEEFAAEIGQLIKADTAFKNIVKTQDLNNWAMTVMSYQIINDPESKPAYERTVPLPGEVPDPDKDKHIVSFRIHMIDAHNMGQDTY